MTPKKALCIHDLSTVGRSSLRIITPTISRLGTQVIALPTAVLSAHFALGKPAMEDLTEFCQACMEHYHRIGIEFDCVYSGFLSSPQQAQLVKNAYTMCHSGLKLCDPVMADNGKLYSTIGDDMIAAFKDLCKERDLITPNPTEALILLDRDYTQQVFKKEEIAEIAEELGKKYCDVIITGTHLDNGDVVCVSYKKNEDKVSFIPLNYIPVSYPGTGDLFGACLVGYHTNGYDLPTACEKTARFIEKVVRQSYADDPDVRYGVHIEPMLKYLID